MPDTILFSPYTLDGITLPNRAVMAPLTRNRAGAGLVPSEFAAEYYSQRAGAGLIITDATPIPHGAPGYTETPGLYQHEQVAAWRQVTIDAPANKTEARRGGKRSDRRSRPK